MRIVLLCGTYETPVNLIIGLPYDRSLRHVARRTWHGRALPLGPREEWVARGGALDLVINGAGARHRGAGHALDPVVHLPSNGKQNVVVPLGDTLWIKVVATWEAAIQRSGVLARVTATNNARCSPRDAPCWQR
jgi:hypothetical protein